MPYRVCIGFATKGRITSQNAIKVDHLQNRPEVLAFCAEFLSQEENNDKRIDVYDVDKTPQEPRYWAYSAIRHHKFPRYVRKHPQDYLPYNHNRNSVFPRGVIE